MLQTIFLSNHVLSLLCFVFAFLSSAFCEYLYSVWAPSCCALKREYQSHALFHPYNRSCTIIYCTYFSLYAKCHILQPLSFPGQISFCIPLTIVSPLLSSPCLYILRSFTLCTCGTVNTGHLMCTHTLQSSTQAEIQRDPRYTESGDRLFWYILLL